MKTPDASLTVRAVVAAYLAHAVRDLAERTYTDRKDYLERFCDELGDGLVVDAGPADLVLYLDRHVEWKSAWTRRRVIAGVQTCFNWAAKMRLIAQNPFAGVTCPPGDHGRPMEPEEFRKLLRFSALACFRRLLFFLRWTGARPGEARILQWTQIDLERGIAILREHKTKNRRRDRHARVIALPPPAIRMLRWLQREEGKEGAVFKNSRRKEWTKNALALQIIRRRREAGLPGDCKLYSLRHSFATLAIERGVELKTLAELLGHTTTRMSEWYVHLAGRQDVLQRAVGRLWS